MGTGVRLRGLYVPVVTPFGADGQVDESSLHRLCGHILSAGATGIVALATTGEASALDGGEQRAVVDVCAAACREADAQLVVGAGTNDTGASVERHRALSAWPEVTAALTVVPYYVRPSQAGVIEHFRAVADQSPVPVLIYNVPYRTGLSLSSAALLALAEVPNVAGVKQSVGALDLVTLELLRDAPTGFAVLCGDDPFMCSSTLMGGARAVAASANVSTGTWARMLEAALAGNVAEATAMHCALLPLATALFAEPNPAVIKGVLHRQGLIATPSVRLPHVAASPGAIDAAEAHTG